MRRLPHIPSKFRAFSHKKASWIFLALLFAASLYQVMAHNGLLWLLPGGAISIIRAFILGMNLVGTFYLAYSLGRGNLNFRQKNLFIFGLLLFMLSTSVSLLLTLVARVFLLATIGYILGAKRIPYLIIALAFIIFSILHAGKSDIRSDQSSRGIYTLQPWDYPGVLKRWLNHSFNRFSDYSKPDELYTQLQDSEKPANLLERGSLAHLFLLAQKKAGEDVPFMYGATYALIPYQLIPRALSGDKLNTLEGTRRLNIHYGLQTAETAKTTSIGWGLVNEAYANFGLVGVGLLAILLGWSMAKATLWSLYTPVLSARAYFGIVCMAVFAQTEFSAGTLVTVLFQSSIALLIFSLIYMNKHRLAGPDRYELVEDSE